MSTMTDSIGRVLAGRYRIESALGTGASAHVFAARDVTLRRRVAIKLLHPALVGDGAFLRRFRAEAQSAAALTHPHVLSVFDWGEDDSGPFLVLEFLGGGSLRDLLDSGRRLSVSQAVSVGAQAAQGLAYAHGRGFVHRDIKPANILFDEESRLRIADFGLARALAEAALTEPAGATVGTARYAAPEQAQGNPVDGRADVYSLSLVLYEAVTGVVPFTADTTISTLMARVGARLPADASLGPLGSVLEEAAAPEPEDRLDAAHLARRLSELSKRLPAPEPLPIVRTARDDPDRGGARGVGTPTDAMDRTEHGMSYPDPGEVAPDSGVSTGADAPTASRDLAEDLDTSQVLAVASAVGVTTGSYRSVEEPLARVPAPAVSVPPGPPPAVLAPRRLRRRSWPWKVAIAVLVVAIVAGGLAIAAVQTKFFTPSHRLPDVVNLSMQQASAKLQRDRLHLQVSSRQNSTTVSAGSVIREIPRAGTSLKEGSAVSVVVSSGPPPVNVPSLAQVTSGGCSEVVQVLGTAHLHANCTPKNSTQVASGGVIDWSPKGTAKEFSTIQVYISSGPPTENIPSLTGSTCQGATTELQSVGLVANCVNTYTTSGTPVGQVIPGGWNPSGTAPEGTQVTVDISEGPPLVTVPQIYGLTVAQAIGALQSAGLVAANDQGNLSGRVFLSSPAQGASVPEGTQVTLYSR